MEPNAYTIGMGASYDRALREDTEPVVKLGRHVDGGEVYEGGIVFRTAQEAAAYIDNNPLACAGYKVYGLILPGAYQDYTHTVEHENFDRIRCDARIVAI